MGDEQLPNGAFYNDMREIILKARSNAIRSIEFARMMMYWYLGERIFVEEQRRQDRAAYGEHLIRDLSKELEIEFGSGFSQRQLERARKFYRVYSNANDIQPQLNWSQYRQLIAIDDDDKREYYELESANNAWTARETERQIHSLLYERLLLSNDILHLDKRCFFNITHYCTSPSICRSVCFSLSFIGDLGSKHISTNCFISSLFSMCFGLNSYSLPCGLSVRAKI